LVLISEETKPFAIGQTCVLPLQTRDRVLAIRYVQKAGAANHRNAWIAFARIRKVVPASPVNLYFATFLSLPVY
jgi:hypothetical protein